MLERVKHQRFGCEENAPVLTLTFSEGFPFAIAFGIFSKSFFFHCSNSFHRLIAFCKSAEAAFNKGFMLFSAPSSNPKPFCVSSFSGTLPQQWKKVCL